MDLDPKGANNQIKEVVDRQYAKDDEEDIHLDEDASRRDSHLEAMDAEDEQIVGNDISFEASL